MPSPRWRISPIVFRSAWARRDKSARWVAPGIVSLAIFDWLVTLVDTHAVGRAFAANGGVYIADSLIWLWSVEGARPERWNVIGAAICLTGAGLILKGPGRSA